jgi:hypothetical protein
MVETTRSWTRHRAWPSASDATRCGVCGMKIEGRPLRGTSSSYRHVVNVVTGFGFDAERQKKLYERLDAIVVALDTEHAPAPSHATREAARLELLAFLETLASWRNHDEAWNTIERWRRDHHA